MFSYSDAALRAARTACALVAGLALSTTAAACAQTDPGSTGTTESTSVSAHSTDASTPGLDPEDTPSEQAEPGHGPEAGGGEQPEGAASGGGHPAGAVPGQPTIGAPGAVLPAPDVPQAKQLIDTLEIKGRAARTGYDRAQFGQSWKDVEQNGCDQRNDVLARDLTQVHAPKGCKVLSGVLDDPYTGKHINFVRGKKTSSSVQIDHIVALADAWQKGAQGWTPEQREAFANDLQNLWAVDGPANQAKGAGDAATWLPPNAGFRCEYVARQVVVKSKYRLWVTEAEHQAIHGVLDQCA